MPLPLSWDRWHDAAAAAASAAAAAVVDGASAERIRNDSIPFRDFFLRGREGGGGVFSGVGQRPVFMSSPAVRVAAKLGNVS